MSTGFTPAALERAPAWHGMADRRLTLAADLVVSIADRRFPPSSALAAVAGGVGGGGPPARSPSVPARSSWMPRRMLPKQSEA